MLFIFLFIILLFLVLFTVENTDPKCFWFLYDLYDCNVLVVFILGDLAAATCH